MIAGRIYMGQLAETRNLASVGTRGGVFIVTPSILVSWMNKRVTLTGLPPDATYLRSWYDEKLDELHVAYTSQYGEELLPGVVPLRTVVYVEVERMVEEPVHG
jgi:hypothetical protein